MADLYFPFHISLSHTHTHTNLLAAIAMDNKKRSFQKSSTRKKSPGNKVNDRIFEVNSQFDHAFSAMDNLHHHETSATNLLSDSSIWTRDLCPDRPNFPLPITSQSSQRAYNSKAGDTQLAVGDNSSGSSPEQSDDDDLEEIEAGACEQSKKPIDTKRIKRMVSNRESARRSRRRKQAHVTDLEQQAEQLRVENASLFKQLEDSTQHFKDSTTNNRVLRSNVDALRAKVKLAEDTVARGSLTTSLNNLLRNYLNAAPHENLSNNMNNPIAVPPYNGISEISTVRLEDADAFFNEDVSAVNHIPEIWTWDGPVSK